MCWSHETIVPLTYGVSVTSIVVEGRLSCSPYSQLSKWHTISDGDGNAQHMGFKERGFYSRGRQGSHMKEEIYISPNSNWAQKKVKLGLSPHINLNNHRT